MDALDVVNCIDEVAGQLAEAGRRRVLNELMSLKRFAITNVNTLNCSLKRRSPKFIVWQAPDKPFVEGQRVLAVKDPSFSANTASVDK
jgi:hypothetical protein